MNESRKRDRSERRNYVVTKLLVFLEIVSSFPLYIIFSDVQLLNTTVYRYHQSCRVLLNHAHFSHIEYSKEYRCQWDEEPGGINRHSCRITIRARVFLVSPLHPCRSFLLRQRGLCCCESRCSVVRMNRRNVL